MDAERDVDSDARCANCGHVRSQHGTPCRACVLVDAIPGETIRICLKFKPANADRTLQLYRLPRPERDAGTLLLHAHDRLARSHGPDWKDRLEAAHICWCALIALHTGRTLQEVWKP